jgi:small-conductance mechanosensitive channel
MSIREPLARDRALTRVRGAAAALCAAGLWAHAAAQPASSPPATAATSTAASAVAAPEPIALSEIADRAQAVGVELASSSPSASASARAEAAAGAELPQLRQDIRSRRAQLDELLARTPSIEALRGLGVGWKELDRRVAEQTQQLTRRIGQLEQRLTELHTMEQSWRATRDTVRAAGDPAGLLEQVDRTLGELAGARKAVDAQRAEALNLQGEFAQLGGQTRSALAAIASARNEAAGRLLQRDNPPLWSPRLRAAAQLAEPGTETLDAHLASLRAYAGEHESELWLHAAFALACIAGVWPLRRPLRRWADQEPELREAMRIADAPILAGALIALLAGGFFYPGAPRLWWSAIGIVSVVPTVLLTRSVIARALYPLLYGVVAFYVIDQLRPLVVAAPLSTRVFFIAEMLAAAAFVGWQLAVAHRRRSGEGSVEREAGGAWRVERTLAQLALALLLAAASLNVLGFVRLGELIGTAIVTSAYLAIVLHAVVEVAVGFIAWFLRVRPLSLLGMVHTHRQLLKLRLQRGLRWLAGLAWLLATLEMFALRRPLFAAVDAALDASARIGSVELNLGSVLLFAATIFVTWLLSRLIRFVLEQEVYPRISMERGMTYAVSRIAHYVVLVAGFVLALAVLGVDMTRFTILVSAIGVGLGFGMQNIVNNFVSGLIVLFERPVEVGDLVQLDDAIGTVERIGIRASVIRVGNGAAVIVPNGKLISDRVTNWSLSSRLRRIDIAVQVPLGADPEQVIRSLTALAADNEHVVATPAPDVLFVKPGPAQLEFERHAWTHEVERAARIRSELVLAIDRQLRAGQADRADPAAPPAAHTPSADTGSKQPVDRQQ